MNELSITSATDEIDERMHDELLSLSYLAIHFGHRKLNLDNGTLAILLESDLEPVLSLGMTIVTFKATIVDLKTKKTNRVSYSCEPPEDYLENCIHGWKKRRDSEDEEEEEEERKEERMGETSDPSDTANAPDKDEANWWRRGESPPTPHFD